MSNLPFHTWNPNLKNMAAFDVAKYHQSQVELKGWDTMSWGNGHWKTRSWLQIVGPKTGLKRTTIRQPGHSYVIIASQLVLKIVKMVPPCRFWLRQAQTRNLRKQKKYKRHWNFRYSSNNWYKQHKQYKSNEITNALYLVSWFRTPPKKSRFQVTNVCPLLWRKIFSPW